MIVGLRKRSDDKDMPTRHFSSKQEMYVAKAVGGVQTSNSGATDFQKGDVLSDKFLLECKTKTKDSDSISIKKEWIEKNKRESLFMGKDHSAVVFNFGPDQENYYIIEEYLFLELIKHLRENKE